MPRNIEIKAKITDLSSVQRRVEAIADHGPTELNQVDTFFNCNDGRLKMREFSDASGVLIYYKRPDVAGPRESVYFVSPTDDPETLKEILNITNGTLGIVKKRRLLYLTGQTRVHLDDVEDLGVFVELEVVLREDQTPDDGATITRDLMKTLNIAETQLINTAYFDLLAKNTPDSR